MSTISEWQDIYDSISLNVRKYLWDAENQKFIPHIYLKCDPFKGIAFDESEIFHRGNSCGN